MKTESKKFQEFCDCVGYRASNYNESIFHAGWQAALNSDKEN